MFILDPNASGSPPARMELHLAADLVRKAAKAQAAGIKPAAEQPAAGNIPPEVWRLFFCIAGPIFIVMVTGVVVYLLLESGTGRMCFGRKNTSKHTTTGEDGVETRISGSFDMDASSIAASDLEKDMEKEDEKTYKAKKTDQELVAEYVQKLYEQHNQPTSGDLAAMGPAPQDDTGRADHDAVFEDLVAQVNSATKFNSKW